MWSCSVAVITWDSDRRHVVLMRCLNFPKPRFDSWQDLSVVPTVHFVIFAQCHGPPVLAFASASVAILPRHSSRHIYLMGKGIAKVGSKDSGSLIISPSICLGPCSAASSSHLVLQESPSTLCRKHAALPPSQHHLRKAPADRLSVVVDCGHHRRRHVVHRIVGNFRGALQGLAM